MSLQACAVVSVLDDGDVADPVVQTHEYVAVGSVQLSARAAFGAATKSPIAAAKSSEVAKNRTRMKREDDMLLG